jgi:hypothetical protein
MHRGSSPRLPLRTNDLYWWGYKKREVEPGAGEEAASMAPERGGQSQCWPVLGWPVLGWPVLAISFRSREDGSASFVPA